jgi:hypothetical protein
MHRILSTFFRKIKSILYALGLNIEPTGELNKIYLLKSEDDLLGIANKLPPCSYFVFDCPIGKVRSWGGRELTSRHPLVATLKKYNLTKNSQFKNSPLFDFSNDYYRIVKDAAECLNLSQKEAPGLSGLDPRSAVYPWSRWSTDKQEKQYYLTLLDEHNVHANSTYNLTDEQNYLKRGHQEINRLIATYCSIEKKGYMRKSSYDGDISGELLLNNGEWIVLVTRGEHRIAALSVLNFKTVPIRIRYADIVRLDESEYWLNVANGVFSKNGAESVFDNIFKKDNQGVYVNVYGWP